MIDLKELIQQGENSAVEFKSADVRAESLAKEMVAFANSQGGTVLVGVEGNGEITGLKPGADFVEWAANIMRMSINPSLSCDIRVHKYENAKIGVINVPKGPDKPYQINSGQYLIRVGSTNRSATAPELMCLFQQAGVFHADVNPVNNASIKDLSTTALDKYLARYDISLAEEDDHETLLTNMDVLKSGVPTVAGMLMFGINPSATCPVHACVMRTLPVRI